MESKSWCGVCPFLPTSAAGSSTWGRSSSEAAAADDAAAAALEETTATTAVAATATNSSEAAEADRSVAMATQMLCETRRRCLGLSRGQHVPTLATSSWTPPERLGTVGTTIKM